MDSMKIVMIGNGPATIKALEAIDHYMDVTSSRRPEVTVISSEKVNAYAPMFLIKTITGQLTESQLTESQLTESQLTESQLTESQLTES